MFTRDEKNKFYNGDVTTVSLVDYGDIRKGDKVYLMEYVQTPAGSCSYYKCTVDVERECH